MKNFDVIVPPNWALLRLRSMQPDAIEELAASWVHGMVAARRRQVQSIVANRLTDFVTRLEEAGMLAVIMSAEPLAESNVRPVMVFSRFSPETGTPLDGAFALAAQDGATVLDVDDKVILRIASEAGPEGLGTTPAELVGVLDENRQVADQVNAALAERQVRRISYLVGHPEHDESWLSVHASVTLAGDEAPDVIGDAYGDLFDAVVKTIRWVD